MRGRHRRQDHTACLWLDTLRHGATCCIGPSRRLATVRSGSGSALNLNLDLRFGSACPLNMDLSGSGSVGPVRMPKRKRLPQVRNIKIKNISMRDIWLCWKDQSQLGLAPWSMMASSLAKRPSRTTEWG
jgi:hypothetical protein